MPAITGARRARAAPGTGAAVARLALAAALVAGCAGTPDHEVEARWARGERPPDVLVEDSNPTLDEDGIELHDLRCDVGADELRYELELDNPYAATLDAWAFTSLDSDTEGHLWGLYQFALPPGRVAVTFPDVLDGEERADVVSTALDEVGGEIVSCSIVLLGVSDHDEAAFVHPVITTDVPPGSLR